MQHRSEETRAHILDAALRQFAIAGYNSASVDEICAVAGVSKGAFYHHFHSKQAVFLALLEGWLTMIDLGLEAARQETVPATLMHMTGLLPAVFATAEDSLPMFLEFWLQASRDETIWQALIAPYQRYQQYFAELVERGKAEGSFRADADAQASAQAFVALAVGLLLQGVLDPKGADWEKTAGQGIKILLKGLEK